MLFVVLGCAAHRGPVGETAAESFRRGVELAGSDQLEAAYRQFDEAARLGGGPRASFDAGLAAERLGRLDDAEMHYRAAVAGDSTYEVAIFALVGVLQQRGWHDEAVTLLRTVAGRRAEVVGALVVAGRHDEAVAEAREVLREDPGNATVYRALSASYRARGDEAMADLLAERAQSLGGPDADLLNVQGVAAWGRGDEGVAVERFRTALALDAGHLAANLNLGFAALASGDADHAGERFEAALEADPGSLEAMLGLAVVRRSKGDARGAGALYDRIIAVDPLYDAAYLNAAVLHERVTGDADAARRYLEALIAVHGEGWDGADQVHGRIATLKRRGDDARAATRADEERRARQAERLATLIEAVARARADVPCAALAEAMDQAEQVIAAGDAELADDALALLEASGCRP